MNRLPERIEFEGLSLRLWTESDVDVLDAAVVENIEHLRPWMPWAAFEPITRTERLALVREWHDHWVNGGDLVVGAFDSSEVVGGGGLHHRLGAGALEIGYWVHHAHLRRGVATRMTLALTNVAFSDDAIERVEIHHDRANVASRGVPEKLGYEFVGEFPDEPAAPSEVGIECRWIMTRRRWANLERSESTATTRTDT